MERTRSFSGDEPDGPGGGDDEGRVIVAFECGRPLAPPQAYDIPRGRSLLIGRGAQRGIEPGPDETRLNVADGWMSLQHVRVRRDKRGFALEELGSKNGTFLDGQRLKAGVTELEDGDVVEAGGTTLVVRARRGPSGTTLDERPAFRTLMTGLRDELATLERIARAVVPVLLQGETGTGKEVVARAIHDASGRKGPFVAVNCASLPPNLAESELFGVRRGAYSGADADRAGLVMAASGGTLFLDEIAELAPPAQATLLRTLQEREVRPLGGQAVQKVDVRVVAATHQDLSARVQAGGFRQDLYARLRGYRMTLPPLRERRDDLGLLIGALLPVVAPERAPTLTFAREVARCFFAYDWPLNIRELEHTLRAAAAIAPGDEIELAHLPSELREAGDRPPPVDDAAGFKTLAETHRGNVTAMARALKTSRTHVRRLARRHGVDLGVVRGSDDEG